MPIVHGPPGVGRRPGTHPPGNLLVRGQDNFRCTGPGQWQVGGPDPQRRNSPLGLCQKPAGMVPPELSGDFRSPEGPTFRRRRQRAQREPVPYLESDSARRALRRRTTGGRMTVSAAMVRPSPVSPRGAGQNTQGTRHRLPEVEFRQRRKPPTTWPTPGSASSPSMTRSLTIPISR